MKSLDSAQALAQEAPRIVISPSRGWIALNLAEVWRYRELLYFLTWRDIKVRYKQTVIGAAWAIVQPFCTMVVFTVIFGKLAKLPTDGLPQVLFYLSGPTLWVFFSGSLSKSSNSLVGNAYLLKKVYFPRLLFPLSSTLSGLVDFAIAFSFLLVVMVYYGYYPTARIIFVPLMVLLALGLALGVGMWLSALNVQFRDVGYVVPFMISLWMWASPVGYPSSMIDRVWLRMVFAVNPMVGVLEGFRWALFEELEAPTEMIRVSASVAIVLLVTGAFYFRRMEKTFADVV